MFSRKYMFGAKFTIGLCYNNGQNMPKKGHQEKIFCIICICMLPGIVYFDKVAKYMQT